MQQIIKGVYFIPGQDEFIPDAHMYVLGALETGDVTLVDAGLMGKDGHKLKALQRLGVQPEHVRRIIMTHTHLDHIGCLPELRQALPQAEVWMHDTEARYLEDRDERVVYGMDMFENMCHAQYGLAPGHFALQADRRLDGGESLKLGGTTWEVLHVPGHSPGCIALYHSTEKVLVAGDVVYADYAIGRFDLHGASGRRLRESLERLGELEVKILLPGHNGVVTDLPPDYIRQTASQWAAYLG